MNESKPASQSLTIQAVAGTLAIVAYQLIGAGMFGLPAIPEGITETLASAGLLVAGYGRVRATKRLGKAE